MKIGLCVNLKNYIQVTSFIVFIIVFSTSCRQKIKLERLTTQTNIVLDKPLQKSLKKTTESVEIDLDEDCRCFDGIGSSKTDKPLLVFNYTDGNMVSVCGYSEEGLTNDGLKVSEFNVFDCKSGKPLVEFGALQNCLVKTGRDTLQINLMGYYPCGENWKWESVKIAKQLITANTTNFNVSELTPDYSPNNIDKSLQEEFLNSLKKGQGFGENWEADIGKLELLSLNGNEKAWDILKNYEDFTGEKTDGALAEMWKDAVANVEWLTKKK